MSQDGVGVQTKSPQDVPLWYVGCCELGQPRHHKLNETSAPPTLYYREEFEFKVLPIKTEITFSDLSIGQGKLIAEHLLLSSCNDLTPSEAP